MAAQCFFTSDMLTSSCGYHTACIHRLKKEFWTIVFPFLQDKDYYNAICLGHFHRIRQLVAQRRSTSCKPSQLYESFFLQQCALLGAPLHICYSGDIEPVYNKIGYQYFYMNDE